MVGGSILGKMRPSGLLVRKVGKIALELGGKNQSSIAILTQFENQVLMIICKFWDVKIILFMSKLQCVKYMPQISMQTNKEHPVG